MAILSEVIWNVQTTAKRVFLKARSVFAFEFESPRANKAAHSGSETEWIYHQKPWLSMVQPKELMSSIFLKKKS